MHNWKKAVFEQTRYGYHNSSDFLELTKQLNDLQQKLEKQYPQLFVSNQEISKMHEQAKEVVKNDPDFKESRYPDVILLLWVMTIFIRTIIFYRN